MRTLSFARFFKQYGDVDIVYSQGAAGPSSEDGHFSNWYHLEKKPYPEGFLGRCLLAVKGVPYPVREYRHNALRRLLELIEVNDYRFIFVRYCHSAIGLFNLPAKLKSRTIVDIDDVLSGSVYASFFDNKEGVHRRLLRALNKKLLTRYETKCLNFGAALFCSDLDRQKLDAVSRGNTFVVPNIYESRSFAEHEFGNGQQCANSLLFVGTLNYAPNIEGLHWFIQTVFRRFKAEFHDAKLMVVGRAPSARVKTLCASEAAVELHPDVSDVRRYYEQCRAVVVPLLTGGGTRIKILEAALANRPVLSTPIGAEGLDLEDGRDLLLFEGAEDFCAKYRELDDPNVYQSLVARACKTVQSKYSRMKFEESMQKVLEYIEGSSSGWVPSK
jgi:glycosyltransferase involved in cell wall biosynthesis